MQDISLLNEIEPEHEPKHHSKAFWLELILAFAGVLVIFFIFGTQYAIGVPGLSTAMESAALINPKDSVIVSFNHRVLPASVEGNLTITPKADVQLGWENNDQKLEIKPVGNFVPGTSYTISMKPQAAYSMDRFIGNQSGPLKFSFKISDAPKVVSVVPASGDPNVKINSNVVVNFDKPVTGFDVNFVLEPFGNFSFEGDRDKKSFTILTAGKLAQATDYAVSVRLAVSGPANDSQKLPEVFRVNFKTESPPPPPVKEVVLPDEDKAAGVVTPSEAIVPKIDEGKYIDINLAKQQLSIFENGKSLGTYKVSTGKRGMATPTGTFKVFSKAGKAYSREYKLYMPYWMQFTGRGHGIHELPEWKNGYKEGANHLGIPVSHGCVRLGVGPAAKVYNWSEVGTPIVIHY